MNNLLDLTGKVVIVTDAQLAVHGGGEKPAYLNAANVEEKKG